MLQAWPTCLSASASARTALDDDEDDDAIKTKTLEIIFMKLVRQCDMAAHE